MIAVGTKKIFQNADNKFYTVLTNKRVSHMQSQGTHIEHTPGYVQSMDQQELQTNSLYWLLEVQNNVKKVFSLMKSETCYQEYLKGVNIFQNYFMVTTWQFGRMPEKHSNTNWHLL